jgi:hypothetical protein
MTSRRDRKAPCPALIEPADRARVAKELFQTPHDPPALAFECHDPLSRAADPVTYRSESFEDIVSLAERVGATHIEAVDPQGERTAWNRCAGALPTSAPPAAPNTAGSEVHATPARLVPIQRAALHAAQAHRIETSLRDQYVITHGPATLGDLRRYQIEYRERGSGRRIAFTASLFKICTDTPEPSVARAMVDVAELRQWAALRVHGDEAFRRMVWLEASARGVQALGYEPGRDDLCQLRRDRAAREVYRVEHAPLGPEPLAQSGAAPARPRELPPWLAALRDWLVRERIPALVCDAVVQAAATALRHTGGLEHKGGRGRADCDAVDASAPTSAPASRPSGPVPPSALSSSANRCATTAAGARACRWPQKSRCTPQAPAAETPARPGR